MISPLPDLSAPLLTVRVSRRVVDEALVRHGVVPTELHRLLVKTVLLEDPTVVGAAVLHATAKVAEVLARTN